MAASKAIASEGDANFSQHSSWHPDPYGYQISAKPDREELVIFMKITQIPKLLQELSNFYHQESEETCMKVNFNNIIPKWTKFEMRLDRSY